MPGACYPTSQRRDLGHRVLEEWRPGATIGAVSLSQLKNPNLEVNA
jgi:hypothetical protein